ncbi:hypothetical protein [Curtobacterium sp. MCBD17_019]|uniref:hypothetical protein n=1 Tax=Curtobacterium sp. MCBD17_019 TaxID=2175669 RepID=UPI0011B544CF|nr:hypothetical protein [Curtobacterium sp. MCBD17_019]
MIDEDLIRLGYLYVPGRGNGYSRDGQRIDRYAVGDGIAAVFRTAGAALDAFIATNRTIARARQTESQMGRLRAEHSPAANSRYQLLAATLDGLDASLPIPRSALQLLAASFHATAREIEDRRGYRDEAITRFRDAITRRSEHADSIRGRVLRYLDTLPAQTYNRKALHETTCRVLGLDPARFGTRSFYSLVTEACPRYAGTVRLHSGYGYVIE